LAELRWILTGLGVVAIAAIWWWSTRRSGQAPGNSELRESTVMPPQSPAPEPRERLEPRDRPEARDRPDYRERPESPDFRERSIPPLEPLSIRTADFERVPILDLPMMPNPEREPDPVEEAGYIETSMPEVLDGEVLADEEPSVPHAPTFSPYATARSAVTPATPPPAVASAAAPPTYTPPPSVPIPIVAPIVSMPTQAPLSLGSVAEHGDRPAAVEPPAPNLSEQQKIVTLRVCAAGDSRWTGRDLMSALEGHGLAYGRYQVYHRKHADGQSIFFVASLIEPGTFDAARMAEEEFRGVSMFAVLPGPIEPLQAVDALLTTARELARDLSGTLQDAKGLPFSPQRIATLREDVARFQSSARDPAA
jgi:cell division protein ZipA